MSKFAPHGRSGNNPRATSSTICQKCLRTGHFTYECKDTRPYVSRPSRTAQLENPLLVAKSSKGQPSVDVPDEFKNKSGTANRILEAKEKQREKEKDKTDRATKRAKRSSSTTSNSSQSGSGSDSESESSSDPGSDSASESSSTGSYSTRSRSRERDERRRRPRGRSLSRE
ncbi:Zinc knuckle domain containing protein [Russula decolorans]|jgi:hypothetical protein